MQQQPLISFVIPVFRNEGAITITYQKLKELFDRLNCRYEIVFINDGSDDNSLNELIAIYNNDTNIRVLSLSRNFGQVQAVLAGFREVTGDAVVCMSADLQEPISLIEDMIKHWQLGNEIVICHRIDREDSIVANVASAVFYRLIKIANPNMPRGGFDFMLLGRNALNALNQIDERNRFVQGDILWLGFKIAFLPYKRLKRTIGKSQWTFTKKLKYFIDGLLNTSYIPIRMMSFVGMITALLGLVYALFIMYARFINNTPFQGWAPIMMLILIIGGLIMLMLGIIGEYVWRIYDETRKRPLYIVDKDYRHDSK